MAKEWAVDESHDGYANIYELDAAGLKILNLNDGNYSILHWLTLLLKNRSFKVNNAISKDARRYLIENFSIDITGYDVIVGYRADDSYFSFAEDFVNNAISVRKLSRAMMLGNLGEQIVLISKKAFGSISFIGTEKAERKEYYRLKVQRDKAARAGYLGSDRRPSYSSDEIYILDIMRDGVKSDDPRI